MVKIVTVALIAKFVHEELLDWDTPIQKYLPRFVRKDDVGQLATMRDLVANRTGLTGAAFYWYQQHDELQMNKSDLLRMACHVNTVKPFRGAFLYSQWNYILIQLVIEAVGGRPFSELAHEAIIKPPNLQHMTFGVPQGDVVAAHAVRTNGVAQKILVNQWTDESGITAGAGGKASLNDLLTLYIALLQAYEHQVTHQEDMTPDSPFIGLRTIFEPQIKARSSKSNSQLAKSTA
ncbi:beta-lactamase/transpeptidase-like protein [Polyplosphaeria fusca]|uniref:Beta-lactamase/transpeptidase-like protein n=1 Tax=Polyplosphaeria fusca TaxID=682080 RepID=A0A9P4QJ76_9PLEO|nr:beta-lactamase/transpeptidase-like protein [Polyplosphaeria fusca]